MVVTLGPTRLRCMSKELGNSFGEVEKKQEKEQYLPSLKGSP